jgi:hypothetical protein
MAAVIAGCAGGSGSSGFDAALRKENAAIDRALGAQACEEIDGLTICASGGQPVPSDTATPTEQEPQVTATPAAATPSVAPETTRTPTPSGSFRTATPTPTATPEPPSAPGINTNLGSRDSIDCEQPSSEAPCLFVFTFEPVGVPPNASYAVAARTRDPDGPWMLSEAPANSAAIEFDPGAAHYQIAVLVFLQPPAGIPEEIDLLGHSGADYAFVTPVLASEPN